MGSLRTLVAQVFHRDRLNGEIAEELQFHVDSRAADLEARGLPAGEARRRARLEFGAFDSYREQAREARGFAWLDDARADVVYAMRTFRRSPGFVAVALISLGLGIGANTLAFSVVNALLLQPLPVADPGRVVFVQSRGGYSHSFPTYRALRDRNVTFDGIAGYRIAPMDVDVNGAPERLWGYLATGNYFDLLGVKPVIGRVFHQADDTRPRGSPYAVISDACWRARFHADPAIAGRVIRINRLPYTVLGVAPPGFRGTELFYRAEIWVPMMMQPQVEARNSWLDEPMTQNTMVIGRLKAGAGPVQAESNLNAIAAELGREVPWANEGMRFRLARPGLVGDGLGAPVRAFTIGLLVLSGLVLLVACANLASLLAARGADRQHEIAIRISIGAGRSRIVRQLIVESLLLTLAGGLAGFAVARLGTSALTAWSAPVDVPIQFDVPADARVFLFALSVSILAGLVFGLMPARQTSRTDPNAALKGAGRDQSGSPSRGRLRDLLVPVQVAFCFVLVAACLLSLRGLQQALTMPIGIQPKGVAMVGFELGLAGYDPARVAPFQQRALEAVRRLPGVRAAAYCDTLPLSIDQSMNAAYPVDRPNPKPADAIGVAMYHVSPDFFRTLGIRILRGRDIAPSDSAGAALVAVVNETFARQMFRSREAIGRQFRLGPGGKPVEVVGIVEDGKYQSLTERQMPAVFDPILQEGNTTTTLLARSDVPEQQTAAEMRRVLASMDPEMPVYGMGSVEHMLGLALFPTRAAAVALSAFGLLAVVLAATGIHGLVAYGVARRQREIGIRLAIGASRAAVLRLVLSRVALLLLVGGSVGVALALAAGQVLAGVIYLASPRDAAALLLAALGLLLVGGLACLGPARRSVRIDPAATLRPE